MCVYVCVHIQYVHLQFSVYTHFASFHTYFFTSVTHAVIQYKQNHLCVVWLGIAVAELCWAQPGHCWGLGSPVSAEREIKREWEGDGERTHTDTYTYTHTHSLSVSTLSLARRQEAAGLNIWVPLMNWHILGVRLWWLKAIRLIFLGWFGVKRGLSYERKQWRNVRRESNVLCNVQSPSPPQYNTWGITPIRREYKWSF